VRKPPDDALGRICRVSVVMLKIVRNRDIAFNALLSKMGQSLVAARVGGVMTTWLPAPKCLEANICHHPWRPSALSLCRIPLRRNPQPARFSLMRSCSSLIARTRKVAIDLLEPYISHVE
jgi:hypothetical protein